MDSAKIKSIGMGSLYADDFQKAYEFYGGLLGMQGQPGENSCYFQLGDSQAFYLEGGYNPVVTDAKSVRAAITFEVGSISALMKKLTEAEVNIIQQEPLKMAENLYWFQCFDPAGNIVEFLGGE